MSELNFYWVLQMSILLGMCSMSTMKLQLKFSPIYTTLALWPSDFAIYIHSTVVTCDKNVAVSNTGLYVTIIMETMMQYDCHYVVTRLQTTL